MRYGKIVPGIFFSRPNRFVAMVEPQGEPLQAVHVKNTGRCRELLQPGARVYLEQSANPDRKTKYSLVAVEKGGTLINMDSQAPNKAAGEWLASHILPGRDQLPVKIRPEYTYGKSRLDFCLEYSDRSRTLVEEKGVTLEREGVLYFPDAPTQRGVKHLEELAGALDQNTRCAVLFVGQMKGVTAFRPNRETHPQFAEALCRAAAAGVQVLCYDCIVTPETMELDAPVKVELEKD